MDGIDIGFEVFFWGGESGGGERGEDGGEGDSGAGVGVGRGGEEGSQGVEVEGGVPGFGDEYEGGFR